MTDQTLQFQAETARLLHIVTHSLYSQKEIFLRELISNASDACDRLRYAALTAPDLLAGDSELKVTITPDKAARTLIITDNGIGVTRDELVENLGTIARSGTSKFVENLAGDAAADVNVIGQFGVGFYSCFMVADKVEVTSHKAGEAETWRWASDGTGSFTVGTTDTAPRGTRIVLHMRKEADEYLEAIRLRTIVKTYSDHIALPVVLNEDGRQETVNAANALWTRPRSEVTEDQYKEFYHHVAHAFDDPWLTIHAHAEGKLDYRLLLFIPSVRPFDLFDPARKPALKLYVRRVFITDSAPDLLPGWLRFVRGLVDSADLPLNVSREMLQHNPVLARIKHAITRRVLTELEKKAEKEPEAYAAFWENFGAVLKEGIYEDSEVRDRLLKLARFRTTAGDELVSLESYIGRMKEGQTAIYTISGEDIGALRKSPQLEGFRAKGVEVLLLTDAVDDFWLGSVPEFDGRKFQSATKAGADLAEVKGDSETKPAEPAVESAALGTLIALFKQVLGETVKDVRESARLTDSPVCLVAADSDIDMRLARLLRQHNKLNEAMPRILEINPRHPLIAALAARATQPGAVEALSDAALLLLDQARIVEGEAIPDPAAFAQRLSAVLTKLPAGQ